MGSLEKIEDFGFQPAEAEIPRQEEFYKLPRRFGSVPVDEAPLGWETVVRPAEVKVTKFENVYPRISLPFQEVERVSFGYSDLPLDTKKHHPDLFPKGTNRLFFGDNLHIMRQLPSNSIDLIYIDPPFFSGRNYNILFGDKNEVRSFTDIWEGGMPGYLIWLNARLYEIKRLLKQTGTVYVHLDWHDAHYVKVEIDKIFGYDNFLNNIVWCYKTRQFSKQYWNKKHDDILVYRRGNKHTFNWKEVLSPYSEVTIKKYKHEDEIGKYRLCGRGIHGRVDNTGSKYIHGIKGRVPIYVGSPDYTSKLDKDEVVEFAKAILTERKRSHGIMLAWNFSRLAKQAAEKLAARENVRLDFVRLEMVNIESPEFRKHVVDKHPDYDNLLTFVQPPEIRVGIKRLAPLTYQFDVAESLSLNPEGKIINVQWDFDYRSRFSSTPGYSFIRGKNKEPVLAVPFKFEKAGKKKIACRVQDDQGGESTWIGDLDVR